MVRTLYVSSGIYHPSLAARRQLKRILNAADSTVTESRPNRASTLCSPADFDVVVCYFHEAEDRHALVQALDRYVLAGGGLFAVHSAAASFKSSDSYRDLLGGRFRDHGPVSEFEVVPFREFSRVYDDAEPFSVRDELYRHDVDQAVEVQFTTRDGEPVVWTRYHGKGRVCYLSLGHRRSSFRHPSVEAIIRQSIHWLSRREHESG